MFSNSICFGYELFVASFNFNIPSLSLNVYADHFIDNLAISPLLFLQSLRNVHFVVACVEQMQAAPSGPKIKNVVKS